MFIGVSLAVPEYESNRMMISAQMCTGQRVVVVCHCVTVAFLTLFSVCGKLGRPYQLDGGSHDIRVTRRSSDTESIILV